MHDTVYGIGIYSCRCRIIVFSFADIFLLSGQIITGLKVLLIYVITAVIRQGIEGSTGSQIGLHPMVTILVFILGLD